MSEEKIWAGTPSQWVNVLTFAVCGVLGIGLLIAGLFNPLILPGFLIPAGFAFWKWIVVRNEEYELTTEKITQTTGVFSKKTEVLELYRVKDMALDQPFLLRLVGLGTLRLMTSDRTDPEFLIRAISGPIDLLDNVRKHTEIRRDQKRVREVDFE